MSTTRSARPSRLFGSGGPPVLVHDLGDSRAAVLLRAVNGRRAMVGAIMMVMDARVVKQDARGALRVMTPKLQRALEDFALMRPRRCAPPAPPPARAKAAAAPAHPAQRSPPPARRPRGRHPASAGTLSPAGSRTPPASPAPPAARAPAAPPARTGSPGMSSRGSPAASLEKRPQTEVTPEIDRLHAALRRSPSPCTCSG